MSRVSIGARGMASALVALLLASCAGSPEAPPKRHGFPGADSAAAAGGVDTGSPGFDADRAALEDIDARLFTATEAALARGDWLAATLALPAPGRPGPPGTVDYGDAEPGSDRTSAPPRRAAQRPTPRICGFASMRRVQPCCAVTRALTRDSWRT